MKRILLSTGLLAASLLVFAQSIDYNLQDDYIAEGYDVVSYFNNKAVEGKKEFRYSTGGASYLFSSQVNLDAFKKNPSKYAPQYGGWCAYAMGAKGEKVTVDPETFEIRDGKLYLFYNAFFTNTLKDWLEEPEALRKKADVNWEKVKYKK